MRGDSMEPRGILLYGYDEDTAKSISESLGQLIDAKVVLISASGREDALISHILDLGSVENTYGDLENKTLMFLGFNDDQLGLAMKLFPKEIARPIFCGLTEQNVNWQVKYLVEHLLEEKALMESRRSGGQ